jgi:hypothetical protein
MRVPLALRVRSPLPVAGGDLMTISEWCGHGAVVDIGFVDDRVLLMRGTEVLAFELCTPRPSRRMPHRER